MRDGNEIAPIHQGGFRRACRLWETRGFPDVVAHVRPVRETFRFQSPEEFQAKAKELALGFRDDLGRYPFLGLY